MNKVCRLNQNLRERVNNAPRILNLKRTAAIFFCVGVLFLGFIGKANATAAPCSTSGGGAGICYVDTNSSGGDGTTQATSGANAAFATIATVNSYTYTSDDQILFKRGDTWQETLTVPSSGTSGHSIIFGAYGTGNPPTIDGKYTTALTWTDRSVSGDSGGIWVNDLETETNAFTIEFTSKTEANSNAFTVQSGTVYTGAQAGQLSFHGTGIATYASKTIVSQTEVYVRVYFKLNSDFAFASSGNNGFTVLQLYSGSTNVAGVYIKSINGTAPTAVTASVNPALTSVYSGTAGEIGVNAWHYIELHWKKGTSSNGGAELYLDGQLKGSNLAVTSNYSVDTIRIGAGIGFSAVPNSSSILYFDTIKADTAYIGASPYIGPHIWSAPLTASAVSYCLFDGVAGTLRASTATLVGARDYYFASNVLYTYSVTNPSSAYSSVNPYILGNAINTNSKNYLTFQYLNVKNYTASGILADSRTAITINYCTLQGPFSLNSSVYGLRFYAATSVTVNNCDIAGNYVGIAASGSGHVVKNTRVYANYGYGILDTAPNSLTYSYCHIYANTLGSGSILDNAQVSGAVDGGNNIASLSNPFITSVARYAPTPVSISIDDIGAASGDDTYIDSMITAFALRSKKISFGVVTGGNYISAVTTKMTGWYADSQDIIPHSWSHRNWSTQLPAFSIQYVGSGSACTMTISSNTLTTSCTGDAASNLNVDLTNASYDTLTELIAYIDGLAAYTAIITNYSVPQQGNTHSKTLADVAAQNIKTASYAVSCDKSRLVADEIASSTTMFETTIPSYTPNFWIWPYNLTDSTTTALLVAGGYNGARATPDVSTVNVLENRIDTYQMYAYSGASLHNMSQSQIDSYIKQLVFFDQMWGSVSNIYWHPVDALTSTEYGQVLDSILSYASYNTLSQQLAYLKAKTNITDTVYGSAATGAINLYPTATSPTVDTGTNVGLTSDYAGVSVPRGAGYDIGAYEYAVPLAPTVGTPTVLSSSSIRWNFTDNANDETGFRIYDGTNTLVASSANANLTYVDETGLSENTQYTGRYAKAYNSYGESTASTAAASKYTLADTPTNLSATAGLTTMDLSVDSFTNATSGSSGYYFSRSGANSGWIQTNSWSDAGLLCGTSYIYSVKYRNGDGTETDSASLTKSTNPCGGSALPVGALTPPIPPAGGFKVVINPSISSGQVTTKTTSSSKVALSLTAGSDTKTMAISNFPDFNNAGQEPYKTTKQWDLCQWRTACPNGEYAVYVKFYTQYGQSSETVKDTITYENPNSSKTANTNTQTQNAQNNMTQQQRTALIAQIKQQLTSLITQLIQMLYLQISQMR